MATMRILIAEDETIIRLDLRELLEKAGHDVCAEARDGEEAVLLARTVELRHLDIEEGEIRLERARERDGLFPVLGLGANVEACLLEHRPQIEPDDRFVFSDQNAHRRPFQSHSVPGT